MFFTPTMASVINGTVAMVPSLAPAPVIPEPSTIVLTAFGFIGLIGWGWRRRAANGER